MRRLDTEARALIGDIDALLQERGWTAGKSGEASLQVYRTRGLDAAVDRALPRVPVTKSDLGREYAEAELLLRPMLDRFAGPAAD